MSVESKKARAEKRAQGFTSDELPEHEPTARFVGIWIEPNEGWRVGELELPRSVVERYCVKVSTPDVLQIAIAKAEEALETHASKGVLR